MNLKNWTTVLVAAALSGFATYLAANAENLASGQWKAALVGALAAAFASIAHLYQTPGSDAQPPAPPANVTPFRTPAPPPPPPPTPRNAARFALRMRRLPVGRYHIVPVALAAICWLLTWACTPAARKAPETAASIAAQPGLCLAALHFSGILSKNASDAAIVCLVEQGVAEVALLAMEEADKLQAGGMVDEAKAAVTGTTAAAQAVVNATTSGPEDAGRE